MQQTKSDQAHAKAGSRRPRIPGKGIAVIGTAGLAAAILLPAGPALAAYQLPAVTPNGSSVGSVTVGSAISLTALTGTFSLGTAVPGDTPAPVIGAVTMDVYTNNASGYNVTVQAATDMTAPAPVPATDTIPAADLSVEDTDTANTATDVAAYVPISAATTVPAVAALVAYSQPGRSAAGVGDTLTENWEFNAPLPDVTTGTYSVTLNYIAPNNP